MTRLLPPLARCLFSPHAIALVGASSDESKHAGLAQRYLRRHGYPGALYPVNPKRREVGGDRAYARLADVPGPVDHAMILLPTAQVERAVAECAEAGVACITVLGNGFAESGPQGQVRQDRLVETVRSNGMRMLGPNSLGLISLVDHVALSTTEVLSLPELIVGRYGVISQSGGMMGALLSQGHARGIGFSRLVSTGNEADLTVGELGDLLVDDAHTDAILLFLECVREPHRLEAMVRRAWEAGKPVVAFSSGRSQLGEQLAAAHTGALAGSGAAMAAFLRDIGVVQVDMLDTLLEIAPLLAGRRPAKAGRVAGVATTGGGGGMVVDRLGQLGVDVAPPSDAVRRQLQDQGIAVGQSTLIDLTLAGTNAQTYGSVLGALMSEPRLEAVVAVVGASAQFRPDRAVAPIIQAAAQGLPKPLAVYLTPAAEASFRLLAEGGVAAFRSPETCADAVRAFLQWRPPRGIDPQALHRVDGVSAALAATQPGQLDSGQAKAVVTALGIDQPSDMLLPPTPADWSDDRLRGLDFPVVAKIVAPGIAHKTEVGGVVVGIAGPRQLREAAARMLDDVKRACPTAVVQCIQVQRMERGLAEALVGYRWDAAVGPTITVGAGGVLAELYRDCVTRMAPVDEAAALAMVEEVRAFAVLRGFRNLPLGDVGALARAVSAMSRLAWLESPRILEAEINPLVVRERGAGAVAVDALVVRA